MLAVRHLAMLPGPPMFPEKQASPGLLNVQLRIDTTVADNQLVAGEQNFIASPVFRSSSPVTMLCDGWCSDDPMRAHGPNVVRACSDDFRLV